MWGSGKTILAFLAMILTFENGYQSALMVPTEVLARQHFEAFQTLVREQGLDIPVVLLTGSNTAKEKRLIYENIREGKTSVIIGTHALIQEKVVYDRLALVITDEQHRFGVGQRELLSNKGNTPHVLVMSATPIPRTLAIILYGDLDISVIDELPAGRQEIKKLRGGYQLPVKGICIYPEAGGNGPISLCDLSHGRAKRDDRGGKCGGITTKTLKKSIS